METFVELIEKFGVLAAIIVLNPRPYLTSIVNCRRPLQNDGKGNTRVSRENGISPSGIGWTLPRKR